MTMLTRIAALDEIGENSNQAFDVNGVSVLIARTEAGIFAIENKCSHALHELAGGKMKAYHIFCPAHGMRFDMRDGCPMGKLTDKSVRTWPVTLVDGALFITYRD